MGLLAILALYLSKFFAIRFRGPLLWVHGKLNAFRKRSSNTFQSALIVALGSMPPGLSEAAGRLDAQSLWRHLTTPAGIQRYPEVDVADGDGTTKTQHVIEAGPNNYMLFDGTRFSTLRKELLPPQRGALPVHR